MVDVEPMLFCSGGPTRPETGWVEPKLDGWRARLTVTELGWFLRTRRNSSISAPWLVDVAEALPMNTVLDGELVYGAGNCADFYPLLGAVQAGRPLTFVAFDVLAVGGKDLCSRPLVERRALLEQCHADSGVAVVPRFPGTDLAVVLAEVDAVGGEGVVWKASSSPYLPGRRTRRWLKSKGATWQLHAERRLADPRGAASA